MKRVQQTELWWFGNIWAKVQNSKGATLGKKQQKNSFCRRQDFHNDE